MEHWQRNPPEAQWLKKNKETTVWPRPLIFEHDFRFPYCQHVVAFCLLQISLLLASIYCVAFRYCCLRPGPRGSGKGSNKHMYDLLGKGSRVDSVDGDFRVGI